MVHIDVSVLRFLADSGLPLLGAFLVRRFADERVKSAILTVLAFVLAIVQDLVMLNGDFVLSVFLSNFVSALVFGFLTHQWIWKPLGVTGDRGVILRLVPGGLGKVDAATVRNHSTWRMGGEADANKRVA
jgi:vacuolar-type H+-ATPase subunit I/STV1